MLNRNSYSKNNDILVRLGKYKDSIVLNLIFQVLISKPELNGLNNYF